MIQSEEEDCLSATDTQFIIETVITKCNSGAQSILKEKMDLLKKVAYTMWLTESRKKIYHRF